MLMQFLIERVKHLAHDASYRQLILCGVRYLEYEYPHPLMRIGFTFNAVSLPMQQSPASTSLQLDLSRNGFVFDLGIGGQQERFAEDHRQGAVPLEGQQNFVLLISLFGHDAKILVIGLHQNVAAPQVNLVCPQAAAHYEKLLLERTLLGKFESR